MEFFVNDLDDAIKGLAVTESPSSEQLSHRRYMRVTCHGQRNFTRSFGAPRPRALAHRGRDLLDEHRSELERMLTPSTPVHAALFQFSELPLQCVPLCSALLTHRMSLVSQAQ